MTKRLLVLVILSLQLAAACTSSRLPDTQSDGQTHWMRACTTDAQCGTLECLCGVCALPCEAVDACQSALGPTATCFDVEASRGAPGEPVHPVAVMCAPSGASVDSLCLPRCNDSADCEALDARLACEDAVCVAREIPPPPVDGGDQPPSIDGSVAEESNGTPPPFDAGPVLPVTDSAVEQSPPEVVHTLEQGELLCADLIRNKTVAGLKLVNDDFEWGWNFEVVDGRVYYSKYSGLAGGEIRRVSTDGSNDQLLVATQLSGAVRLALEGGELVWAETNTVGAELHSMPASGGAVQALGPKDLLRGRVSGLVVDTDYAYWRADDQLLRSDRSPGATVPLAAGIAINDTNGLGIFDVISTLEADDTYLYYVDGLLPEGPRTIRRVPKDGSAEPSAFIEDRLPFGFTVAQGYLYFSERGKRDELGNHDGSGRIMRKALGGTELETVAEPAGEPMALAVDGSGVYWIEVDFANRRTELWRAPREGGGPSQRLLSSDLRPLHTIRLTDGEIYWKAFCESDGPNNIPGDTYILGIAKP